MRVRQMENAKGKPVANHFIIEHNGAVYFQSYDTIIAKRQMGRIILDKNYWDYSTTTGKFRNQFLREKKVDTERKIREGIYRLENLNIEKN